ncbi:MAG: GGDEF domain-containing response regulator [Rhodospirillaceae bacterium]|nr:GGDEF domain-containing response regulator [Rhodospirillaceae bacterium]
MGFNENSLRVLLTETDQHYADYLRQMIVECCPQGTIVEHATTTDGALGMLQGKYYDLCFLEHDMGGEETGLDVLKHLRGSNAMTAFVFLTDHASKEAAFESMTLGAMDYLIKDRFTKFELAKCISFSMYLKRREIELQKEALRDSLTGLGNKGLFEAQLKQSGERAKRDKEKLGLLVIDVDGFKAVNDKYGHKVGDKLLQQISERIVGETRASDVVARIGGDEFAAIIIKPKSIDHTEATGKKIEKSLSSEPYNIDGIVIKVSSSVGCATLPDDVDDLDQLFCHADKNMYKNKKFRKSKHGNANYYIGQTIN